MTDTGSAIGDELFERERPRLRGLAYRMLGSLADAEDVVQDAWLRWQGTDRLALREPEAWLTTVATRLALDRIRSAQRTRETYPGPWLPEPLISEPGPDEAAELADSLTFGFLILLDELEPVERAVFVLADVFDVPFRQIAETVGRSEVACRQIASRARRRIHGARHVEPHQRVPQHERQILDRLLVAVAAGDVDGVVAELAPGVVLLSDGGPLRRAARRPVVGATRVARLLVNLNKRYAGQVSVRYLDANGEPGVLVSLGGEPDQLLSVEVDGDRITALHVVRNPEKLHGLRSAPPPVE